MHELEPRPIVRYRDGAAYEETDPVVVEAPLEIRLGDTPIAVLMRTPGADEDLIRGFALTEAIALRPAEIAAVRAIGDGDRYELVLADGVTVDPEQFRRNLYASSSCGVCGKASIDAVRITAAPLGEGPVVLAGDLPGYVDAMARKQAVFTRTGGLHAAALFTQDGTMVGLREDVGRHNAIDKLIGHASRDRWRLGDSVVVVSGRVSFEMVQKAAVAGIPVIAGVSAASSLAAELAEELGMTVVGFLRPEGFNVYAGAERIRS